MTNIDINITTSAEYKAYIKALARLSHDYVEDIRKQFACRAYEKYQDESIRRLVLAYGEELQKLEDHYLNDFTFAVEHDYIEAGLKDNCMNKAKSYADAIKFFFLD